MRAFFAPLFFLTAGSCLAAAASPASVAAAPSPWMPDLGNGTYKNPIIFADYSDPDVTRVGDDFYLVASSFTCVPGLPILHSKDLVNWTLISHALPVQVPADHFSAVQSGGGVWAPSIRFHNGKFYIFYPDPDYGIYMVTATDPAGPWSAPTVVKGGKGLEDPCPLWDDDGKVWLVHGWVGSRSGGKNNTLTLLPLSADATQAIGEGKDIINGVDFKVTTAEGPKFYKRNGYYYIFAPVGGVGQGQQAVFRSKTIEGPYEMKIVLAQGSTKINGPHQGGLVDTPDGKQWWFIHFQDMAVQKGNEGRVTHLEPVVWNEDGWPVMGNDPNHTGTGEPVLIFTKPAVGKSYPAMAPQTSDEFDLPTLGLQWQWLANSKEKWYSLAEKSGSLRLFAQENLIMNSLVRQPNLLLQKIPAPAFTVTTKMDFSSTISGESAGLIIYGAPCAWIGLVHSKDGFRVSQVVSRAGANATVADTATESAGVDIPSNSAYLAFTMVDGARVQFSYSLDGKAYTLLGEPVTIAAVRGSWIGAKFGLFVLDPEWLTRADYANMKFGHADFDWIHVVPTVP